MEGRHYNGLWTPPLFNESPRRKVDIQEYIKALHTLFAGIDERNQRTAVSLKADKQTKDELKTNPQTCMKSVISKIMDSLMVYQEFYDEAKYVQGKGKHGSSKLY